MLQSHRGTQHGQPRGDWSLDSGSPNCLTARQARALGTRLPSRLERRPSGQPTVSSVFNANFFLNCENFLSVQPPTSSLKHSPHILVCTPNHPSSTTFSTSNLLLILSFSAEVLYFGERISQEINCFQIATARPRVGFPTCRVRFWLAASNMLGNTRLKMSQARRLSKRQHHALPIDW